MGFGVVELDGQGGVGHADGEGLPGVEAAEGDLLAAHHDDAGGAGAALPRTSSEGDQFIDDRG